MNEWVRIADERGTLPPMLHVHLRVLRDMIADDIGFDQPDFDLLEMVLEITIANLEEGEVDPLMEQAYAKCSGWWFEGMAPWYDRIRSQETQMQLPPLGT